MLQSNKSHAAVGREVRAPVPVPWAETVRKDFPLLGARDVVYLDSAATALKPQPVIDAMMRYYTTGTANVHRGLYGLAEEATALYEAARDSVQHFLHAPSRKSIIFTKNTTEAINCIATLLSRAYLGTGDSVAVSAMEHHSNLVPWQLQSQQHNYPLHIIPFDGAGNLELDVLTESLARGVKVVALTHMSNVFGTINPVRRIADEVHAAGALLVVDAAQSVPRMPVDVTELGCDFLVFSGHKLYGPTGVGVLYGREDLLERLPPFLAGGDMISSVWLDHADWNELPWKFEAGTPPIAEVIGLGAAVDYMSKLGMDSVYAHETNLTDYALAQLRLLPFIAIYGVPEKRGGVISFNIGGVHPHDGAQFLDQQDIAIRAGHHCAQPIMRALGIPACLRASMGVYSTTHEIDLLVEALDKTRRFFNHAV